MLVRVSAFLIATAMPALHQSAATSDAAGAGVLRSVDPPPAPGHEQRFRLRVLRLPSHIRAQGDFGRSLPPTAAPAARDTERRQRLRRGRRSLLPRAAGVVHRAVRGAGGHRRASSALERSRYARRHGPRRSVGRRPKGSLSRRGRAPASGRQHRRRVLRQSDGPRDGELVSRARRLYGAAVRQLSARRGRLHIVARGDVRVGSLEMGRKQPRRCASEEEAPDRTAARMANRATR